MGGTDADFSCNWQHPDACAGIPSHLPLDSNDEDIDDSKMADPFEDDDESETSGSDEEEDQLDIGEGNEHSETPWDRPCPQSFVWDGNRDVMVLVDPSCSQRGWCQARVVRETASTLHVNWPGVCSRAVTPSHASCFLVTSSF